MTRDEQIAQLKPGQLVEISGLGTRRREGGVMAIVSPAFMELWNLRNAAAAHHAVCDDPGCDVSLGTLRETADRLMDAMPERDQARAEALLRGWQRGTGIVVERGESLE
jgi:hypothetical protein